MTFQYRVASGSDFFALAAMAAIQRPPTRRLVTALLLLLTLHVAILSYLEENRDIIRAGILFTVMIVVVPPIAWLFMRFVSWRIDRGNDTDVLQQVTISPEGFSVCTAQYAVTYKWAAVSKVIMSRSYVYVFLDCAANGFGHAFAMKRFDSPNFASRLWTELACFVDPGRMVNRQPIRVG
jgi:hypothetical protein